MSDTTDDLEGDGFGLDMDDEQRAAAGLPPMEDLTLEEPTVTAVTGTPPQIGGIPNLTSATIASTMGDTAVRRREDIASVGRIVHFTDGRGCLAAIVIAVNDKDLAANVVSLQVMAPGSPIQQFYGCANEPAPADPYAFTSMGKWHWPERV